MRVPAQSLVPIRAHTAAADVVYLHILSLCLLRASGPRRASGRSVGDVCVALADLRIMRLLLLLAHLSSQGKVKGSALAFLRSMVSFTCVNSH